MAQKKRYETKKTLKLFNKICDMMAQNKRHQTREKTRRGLP